MKRLFFAAIVAVGIHALLLAVKMEWGKGEILPPPSPMVLSLSYKTPEVMQTPSPEPIEEPSQKADLPAQAKPEEPQKSPVPKPESLPQKKRPPRKVPDQRVLPEIPSPPPRVEPHAALDEPPTVEAQAPSPPASATEHSSAIPDSRALAAKPNLEAKKAPAKEAVPLYLKNPPPVYPSVARRRGYEGMVVLDVLVDREGRVRDLSVSQSSGHGVLDRAAMQAVRGWLFEPATAGDETMDMWVKVPLTFRLK